jgi:hypothetical protein
LVITLVSRFTPVLLSDIPPVSRNLRSSLCSLSLNAVQIRVWEIQAP